MICPSKFKPSIYQLQGLIDDIIIGNAYASEAEIQKLAALNRQMMTFGIELDEAITELERVIVEEEPHFYRGDISEYMIRSTQSRVKYKSEAFPKGKLHTHIS